MFKINTLKPKIDKNYKDYELALITVNDYAKAKTWLNKNGFTIIDVLCATDLHPTTMINISGNKYNKIRLCKFTWFIKIEKNSSRCYDLLWPDWVDY